MPTKKKKPNATNSGTRKIKAIVPIAKKIYKEDKAKRMTWGDAMKKAAKVIKGGKQSSMF